MSHPEESRFLNVLGVIIDSLRRARVSYMLIGAWALAFWGRPRATMDLDFMVMLEEDDFGRFEERLIQEGFFSDETWLDWNPMLRGLQLRMEFRGVTADFMRPRDSYDNQAFLRRRKKRVAGRYFWVVAPEDLMLQKLKVGRPRDFEDVLSVLERSRRVLDFNYLKKWAGTLGLTAELYYLLEQ